MRHEPSCLKYRLPSRRNLQSITQEIIRRHPDYQADWQKHVDPKWPVLAPMPGAASKWGIPILFNPATPDFAPDFIDQPSLIPAWGRDKAAGQFSTTISDRVLRFVEATSGGFLVRIMPSAPLRPQIDALEDQAKIEMPELVGKTDWGIPRKKYQQYVKIIRPDRRKCAATISGGMIADVVLEFVEETIQSGGFLGRIMPDAPLVSQLRFLMKKANELRIQLGIVRSTNRARINELEMFLTILDAREGEPKVEFSIIAAVLSARYHKDSNHYWAANNIQDLHKRAKDMVARVTGRPWPKRKKK